MVRKLLLILMIGLLVGPAFGQRAPSFNLPTIDGGQINLNDYLGKNIIALSFFTSWSDSCQAEITFLQDLERQYQNKGLKVIAVSLDRKTDVLLSFITTNNFNIPIAHDKNVATLKDFKILIMPTLFIINREGELASVFADFDENTRNAATAQIEELLIP